MIAEKVKILRETSGYTQADLAKKLNITRSSVNAWEMGISTPSTQYLVEMSLLFHVSTDYLLGLGNNCMLDIGGLSEEEAKLVFTVVNHFREEKEK